MSDSDTVLVTQFESLGDNCEFGFVQRHYGAEPSGLLRWAFVMSFEGLLDGIVQGFAGIFEFRNLRPLAVDMVLDNRYKLGFHTNFRCKEVAHHWVFAQSKQERCPIYLEEIAKVKYLREKTLTSLRNGEKIFVYKRNSGMTAAEIRRLKKAIDTHGNNRLLCVVPEETVRDRGIRLIEGGVTLATIDRLASYKKVEDASYESWKKILAAVAGPWSHGSSARNPANGDSSETAEPVCCADELSLNSRGRADGTSALAEVLHSGVGELDEIDGKPCVVTRKGQMGFALFGPYRVYNPGTYSVTYRITVPRPDRASCSDNWVCCYVDVAADEGCRLLARAPVLGAALKTDESVVTLEFALPQAELLEFRVYATGVCPLIIETERSLFLIPVLGDAGDPGAMSVSIIAEG